MRKRFSYIDSLDKQFKFPNRGAGVVLAHATDGRNDLTCKAADVNRAKGIFYLALLFLLFLNSHMGLV